MDTVQETLKRWDFFDMGITHHGFTKYQRDYQLDVDFIGADNVVKPYVFLFRGCMEMHYECILAPHIYPTLMDDTFIDFAQWEAADYPSGYVWGVNFAVAYPGWTYHETSPKAAAWTEKLGISMHEIEIKTNVYCLSLVFHDLVVNPLAEEENKDAEEAL